LESAELLEIFQWKNKSQVEEIKKDESIRKRVKEELGDIFIYAIIIANEFGFDPADIILEKLRINEEKYPVRLAKGKANKYTDYIK